MNPAAAAERAPPETSNPEVLKDAGTAAAPTTKLWEEGRPPVKPAALPAAARPTTGSPAAVPLKAAPRFASAPAASDGGQKKVLGPIPLGRTAAISGRMLLAAGVAATAAIIPRLAVLLPAGKLHPIGAEVIRAITRPAGAGPSRVVTPPAGAIAVRARQVPAAAVVIPAAPRPAAAVVPPEALPVVPADLPAAAAPEGAPEAAVVAKNSYPLRSQPFLTPGFLNAGSF